VACLAESAQRLARATPPEIERDARTSTTETDHIGRDAGNTDSCCPEQRRDFPCLDIEVMPTHKLIRKEVGMLGAKKHGPFCGGLLATMAAVFL
jgi:hypothetical protein